MKAHLARHLSEQYDGGCGTKAGSRAAERSALRGSPDGYAAFVTEELSAAGAEAACSVAGVAYSGGDTRQNEGVQSVCTLHPHKGNATTQPRARLIGELVTDRDTNMSSMLLECAYAREALIYASAILADEEDSYWKTGLVPEGGANPRRLWPGEAFLIGSLEQAVICGMRIVRHLGRRSGSSRDYIVMFHMDKARGKTRIDATYSFKRRLVNLAIREERGVSAIVLYVMPPT